MASLTLRIDKGAPLTNSELDDNFRQLNRLKVELGGDLSGSTSAPVVQSLRGNAVSSATPTTGQTLTWTGLAWSPTTPTNNSGLAVITVLNDISNLFNNRDMRFPLLDGSTAMVEGINYGDNRDFTVFIGTRSYRPATPQTTTLGPCIVEYTAEQHYTFKVSGSTIIFSRAMESRSTADIRINNVSAARQQRSRYPFNANSIVLGD
jgi:hypothetical protein